MTPHPLMPPPYCLGCPHPIYDDRRGKGWQWYCRLHSLTGIPCTNVAVLLERCHRVAEYCAKMEATQ
jgi:hypothetical protein